MIGDESTIVAVSTPPGRGGIAVVRMSGPEAVGILQKCWKGADLRKAGSHTAHLGWITDAEGEGIDQTVATIYRAPHSYTGENVVEISCHGSPWIQQAIVNRLIENGASPAGAGEFTRRAFLNGRLDLAQAEGVADMIAAGSRASARLAATQLRGDFSEKLRELRQRLVDIGSLLELELDFSEEDVEFADREQLIRLTDELIGVVSRLGDSYRAGNAFKNGVPVAIAGIPNAGKSTLLNALVGEEKAIVSEVAGTTRDIIEDTAEIDGILFRFYDTAGLRESDDLVETIGIERARKKIGEAFVVLRLIDPTQPIEIQRKQLDFSVGAAIPQTLDIVTKADVDSGMVRSAASEGNDLRISAKTGEGIERLRKRLVEISTADFNPEQELVVTNARHYESLRNAQEPLKRLKEGLHNGLPADLLAQDLREAEHHLGTITGEVTSSDILHTIFARYCIGK